MRYWIVEFEYEAPGMDEFGGSQFTDHICQANTPEEAIEKLKQAGERTRCDERFAVNIYTPREITKERYEQILFD